MTAYLSIIAPHLITNMAQADNGELVIVSGESWAAAHYFAYSDQA